MNPVPACADRPSPATAADPCNNVTHVIVLNEIAHPEHHHNGWRLCLHWARYQYDDKSEPETGYRFIWRRPDGSLQPARGQARIPSLADAEHLIRRARQLGWGDRHADDALGHGQ